MSQIPLLDRIMQLKDPRQPAKCSHDLGEIVFMTTCALLCGADDWNGIEFFAHEREDWFRQYLQLPGGIPSHNTFNRVFSLLDPVQFRELFTTWVQDVLIDTPLSGVVKKRYQLPPSTGVDQHGLRVEGLPDIAL